MRGRYLYARGPSKPRRPSRRQALPDIEPLERRDLPSGWMVVPPANLAGQANELRAVAASPTDAWAVGDQAHFRTLAEHWNGTAWQAVATPNRGSGYNLLNGVAELSPSNVWAVGQSATSNGYLTLVEHWNGTGWTIVPSPNVSGAPQNVLNAITAVGPTDIWAAGFYQDPASLGLQPLTEHWNGSQWSIVTGPKFAATPNLFFGIAAAGANDVWAVGRINHTPAVLIEHWNGQTWSIVPAPSPGASLLAGVTVVSANDVWAVGQQGASQTLAEHWNGTRWSTVPTPNPSGSPNLLQGVAAVASNQVFAVGSSGSGPNRTLTEVWDGSRWTVVASPNPGTLTDRLAAVAALSSGRVWAVGSFSNLNGNQPGPQHSIILTMTGGGVAVQAVVAPTPGPAGASFGSSSRAPAPAAIPLPAGTAPIGSPGRWLVLASPEIPAGGSNQTEATRTGWITLPGPDA